MGEMKKKKSYPYTLLEILCLTCRIIKVAKRFQTGKNRVILGLPEFTNKNKRQPAEVKVTNKYLGTDLHYQIFVLYLKFKLN